MGTADRMGYEPANPAASLFCTAQQEHGCFSPQTFPAASFLPGSRGLGCPARGRTRSLGMARPAASRLARNRQPDLQPPLPRVRLVPWPQHLAPENLLEGKLVRFCAKRDRPSLLSCEPHAGAHGRCTLGSTRSGYSQTPPSHHPAADAGKMGRCQVPADGQRSPKRPTSPQPPAPQPPAPAAWLPQSPGLRDQSRTAGSGSLLAPSPVPMISRARPPAPVPRGPCSELRPTLPARQLAKALPPLAPCLSRGRLLPDQGVLGEGSTPARAGASLGCSGPRALPTHK